MLRHEYRAGEKYDHINSISGFILGVDEYYADSRQCMDDIAIRICVYQTKLIQAMFK